MKKGFTLAEVLITLAIIGVVAALTIPSVIVKTQQQEYRTAAKKAYSVLSQAVQLTQVQDGYTFRDEDLFVQALVNNMNVVKEEGTLGGEAFLPGSAFAVTITGDTSNYSFYTADGFRYEVVDIDETGVSFIVDVNGDKGPSTLENGAYTLATYENAEDLTNPDWTDVILSDIFQIRFREDSGSTMIPNADVDIDSIEGTPEEDSEGLPLPG